MSKKFNWEKINKEAQISARIREKERNETTQNYQPGLSSNKAGYSATLKAIYMTPPKFNKCILTDSQRRQLEALRKNLKRLQCR